MINKFGNMWSVYDEADHFLFTANSTINNLGLLVMGKGMARQVQNRFPYLPSFFGGLIEESESTYHILSHIPTNVSAFQVKTDWRKKASLDLIWESTFVLRGWVLERPLESFHMNYPGIGAGGLSYESVSPIVSSLPDNVFLWRLSNPQPSLFTPPPQVEYAGVLIP